MPLHPDFPSDPYAILDPAWRWAPGSDLLKERGVGSLSAPLVAAIRDGVKEWRDQRYTGASATTIMLLNYWFNTPHTVPQSDGTVRPFRWYFAQREAVESAIWLHEVQQAHDPYSLLKYDRSGLLSQGMFAETWPRYVMKLATGAGKTKVMSLLMAWSYFCNLYDEAPQTLSTNFLLIAPNIIVLDRLRTDFDGARIFHDDPILPPNGLGGNDWRTDFQLTVHIQDDIGQIAERGNLFLTNIHRVFDDADGPSVGDGNAADYFIGTRPVKQSQDRVVSLNRIVRDVPDLVILNDEGHHIHDPESAWFRAIEDIANRLRQKGRPLSAQFDLTATPRGTDGAIFPQTISDYPLVEAIRQGIVKTPVLPDAASRAKMTEHISAKFSEQYADYLHLGYLEWKKSYQELSRTGKKPVMFIMTDDTRNCDEVAEFLEGRYPELKNAVLVIHTKNNGDISEASTGKNKEELDRLRKASREIDSPDSPYKAIVSVMVLREGWDVQNVTTIVGLRPFTSRARILPEQTLGRGLRRMFRDVPVTEKVSIIGTEAFMQFVDSLKQEGVELDYLPMNDGTAAQTPLVIEVDRTNAQKDIAALDIEVPILTARIHRTFKDLHLLDVAGLKFRRLPIRQFSEAEQRTIIFRDLDKESDSHATVLDTDITPDYRNLVGYFVNRLRLELNIVSGLDILFAKVKQFLEQALFSQDVDLSDPNILRNLSEPGARQTILTAMTDGINALTVKDRGSAEIRETIKLSQTRPYLVQPQAYFIPKKSIFNRIVGDSGFELKFAEFLDRCADIQSFIKNAAQVQFRMEYQREDGGISDYIPDFIVQRAKDEIWIVETKGREDFDDRHKWKRLKLWCKDASRADAKRQFLPLLVREDDWDNHYFQNFTQVAEALGEIVA